jgi:ribosome-binding factor A
MAERRLKRIGSLLKAEISAILQEGLAGSYEAMISITDVDVAADLRNAKVFVSIYGDDTLKDRSFKKLTAYREVFKKELFKRIRLRYIPEITFVKDNSLEEGSRISALLERLEEEREKDERDNEDS